jgi:hypothetical protein
MRSPKPVPAPVSPGQGPPRHVISGAPGNGAYPAVRAALPASGEDAPHDRADTVTQAGTPPARPDEAPNHPDPAEARQEADIEEAKRGEDEESRPVTLEHSADPRWRPQRVRRGRRPAAHRPGLPCRQGRDRSRRGRDAASPEATDFDVWSRAPRRAAWRRHRADRRKPTANRGREEPEEAAQAGARRRQSLPAGEAPTATSTSADPGCGETDAGGAARALSRRRGNRRCRHDFPGGRGPAADWGPAADRDADVAAARPAVRGLAGTAEKPARQRRPSSPRRQGCRT